MEYMTLIGILIIVVGFALKLDVLAVVIVSGIVTGLVAGIDFVEILRILGDSFVNNRLMSIFLIIFPVIAIIERYGLKERAAYLIGKLKNASAGKVLSIYMVIRSIASALNVRIGGHVQFVRPLILPMSEAAAEIDKEKPLTEKEDEDIKGLSAAVENYGNFFAQNCFPASSGVVLIQGTLVGLGYKEITLSMISSSAIYIAVIAVILTIVQVLLYDRKLKKEGKE
ncbi:MAG: DUF969 domain-containing protein [Longibaculum muris]|uniref:Putative membrane protein n=1 Tax=Longibaculum muris TaxID=1796628 RepID=A0A4V2W5Q9_9FIRM|nr:DUF969 domain-containing protein [Longibaculum muris]KXU45220.1 hypothetical protein HMPREF3037_02414 [Candidatus Stoquefichus sp. KLE1796]MBS5368839.1 DUF969 domain-containing protein [Coprobacillus cateniformis]MCR1888105.1 DUF969 domain-containing protein [Longibaculum muris]MED9810632.1 DUF969 domain-containing protein [Longibaculum muris]TCW00968.1 putative membrane protein [Longibaculum muris]